MRTPLRRKILLYSSSVLIVLIVTMLVYVSYQASRFVNDRIQSELVKGRERIKTVEATRLRNLQLTATLVASLPNFFAALDTDTATLRDYLIDYQHRAGTDLLIALNKQGRVVARTDMPEPMPVTIVPESTILQTPTGTYHIAAVPADSTGVIVGYVVAGAIIDDNFSRELKGPNDEVMIASEMVLASTLARQTLPWQKQSEWQNAVGIDADPRSITVTGDHYQAAGTTLGAAAGPKLFVTVMQSYDRAMQPYRKIQIGLLLLGIFVALVGVALSEFLARTITAPVAKLVEGTQQVAALNFDYRLDIPANDEIGDLARSFNTMIQGLRERADMQKFVSLSTVEMIQSTASKKVSAGEKVVLTVFFSDMRGFTAMSENRPPEETVKLLNACLSLQADKVKKFRGDIDKFVGDCVVALFTGDDMELNAIRCAVETHRALQELNSANSHEQPIRVGIGIVTGEVILGSIGSADRLDYTVIGSNVNLCSRLCSHAGPGETLLAESTYKRVEGLIGAQKVDALKVKGFSEPIPVYKMASS